MNFWTSLLNGAFLVMQVITGLIDAYQVVLSIFGLFYRNRKVKYLPKKRFAVLVASHNEEQVIGPLVENLKRMEYPKEWYDVYVIADNCIDHTAVIARQM